MDFKTKLYEIYELASSDDVNVKAMLEKASDLYVECYKEFPDELKDVFEECVNHVNMDVEDGTTLGEYISQGECLVEDLSGFLGEFFA